MTGDILRILLLLLQLGFVGLLYIVLMRFAGSLLRGAKGFGHNDFKVDLARRAIVRTLTQGANGTPQTQSDKRVL